MAASMLFQATATDTDVSLSDDESIFFTSIALSRCTSFIATDGQDTVAEILKVLIEDPELRWERLLCFQPEIPIGRQVKDVQFFLAAFESDLRAEANSTPQYHACAFLRRRLRHISSRIYEHYDIEENFSSGDVLSNDEHISGSLQRLEPIGLDELDSTLVPAFSSIQDFLFNGLACQSLKENIRNFAQHTRNHDEEMIDIILWNIHPPKAVSHRFEDKWAEVRRAHLSRFLFCLELEAEEHKLSASDRAGLKKIRQHPFQLIMRVMTSWTSEIPSWHHYPLIPGIDSCLTCGYVSGTTTYSQTEIESFETFVCSSEAFLTLARTISGLPHKNRRKSGCVVWQQGLNAQTPSDGNLRKDVYDTINYDCPCGKTIVDSYAPLSAESAHNRSQQLRLLSVRQMYQQAASQHSPRSYSTFTVRRFLSYFTGTEASSNIPLPQHQPPDPTANNVATKQCITQSGSVQHKHHFIHWCIPRSRYAVRMSPLQSCQIRSDLDFFKLLIQRYLQSKGRYKMFLSFKKPTALRFVKLVDIHTTDDIPPESYKDEYEYYPMPAETVPPIGPNLLMHFFTHPDESPSYPVLLPSIPKRKNDKLEPCPIRGSR
ncbi:hypothetical protein IG631_08606 [Alternaria alternata]|nr:hypothetical protein IG631_08606 [Alternaria alternata]